MVASKCFIFYLLFGEALRPHLNDKLVEHVFAPYAWYMWLLNSRMKFEHHDSIRYGVAFQLIARMKAQGASLEKFDLNTNLAKYVSDWICVHLCGNLPMTLHFKLVKLCSFVHPREV